MNDDHTLTVIRDRLAEVRDSLGEVHRSIPASEIIARARRRRTRRWLATTGAACAAMGLAVALALPSGSQARPVHVHLAAWSVDSNSNGTVTLTVHELTHLALLVRVLGKPECPQLSRSIATVSTRKTRMHLRGLGPSEAGVRESSSLPQPFPAEPRYFSASSPRTQ